MKLRDLFSLSHWWGKIFGAFFGFLLFGPLGSLFGLFIGNIFDRGLQKHFNHPYWHYYSERRQEIQKQFFEATFLVMGYIAKADGTVSKNSINYALRLMDQMGLNKDQTTKAKNLFNLGKQPAFNPETKLVQLAINCHDNQELLQLFLDIQYKNAHIDGYSTKKIQKLNEILKNLGFAPFHQQFRFYHDFYHFESDRRTNNNSQQQHTPSPKMTNLDYAFAILELKNNANKNEVKKAYRKLMSKNHPDKLIAKGLPEEMIKLANDKTQKISKAYNLICKENNW